MTARHHVRVTDLPWPLLLLFGPLWLSGAIMVGAVWFTFVCLKWTAIGVYAVVVFIATLTGVIRPG